MTGFEPIRGVGYFYLEVDRCKLNKEARDQLLAMGDYFTVLVNPEKQEIAFIMADEPLGLSKGRGDYKEFNWSNVYILGKRLVRAGMYTGVYLHYGKGLFRHTDIIGMTQ